MLFLANESGQGQAEYALILILVAMVLMTLLAFVGQFIVQIYQWINEQLAMT
jgi:Flp pilus assembly pilin Flp